MLTSHLLVNRDIIFSPEVSASLSSAAQQKRLGESKVIAARAEVDAARLMRQAADILASPAAMQIRQLEALQQMAKTAQTKVVFVPMQLQGDVASAMSRAEAGGEGTSSGSGLVVGGNDSISRTGVLSSISEV